MIRYIFVARILSAFVLFQPFLLFGRWAGECLVLPFPPNSANLEHSDVGSIGVVGGGGR